MSSASRNAIGLIAVAVVGLIYTLVSGNRPLLGLDLQGGVSVVLESTTPASADTLDQTVEIIRNRVDAIGVAEPEITRQGNAIVVDLPGVNEQQRALELVGQTAELRFRPVLADLGPDYDPELWSQALAQIEGVDAPEDATLVLTDDELAFFASLPEECLIAQSTPIEHDDATEAVVLAGEDGLRRCLGPTLLTGDALESASPNLTATAWFVSPVFKSGADGIDAFNRVAAMCFPGTGAFMADICPLGRLAIVLDGVVMSDPTINAANFARDQITITGQFTESEAKNLALVLNYGALPVELEPQQVRTVSATIGDDVLEAGIISALIGLALMAVYLLWYYRLAALIVLAGLALSFVLLWTTISWLGTSQGLALTLSGVVGLIVSIGISADSNIVYFETVKEALANGKARRVGVAVERGYRMAISTIVKAGVVSLIAAVLLYWLTVGAVRGFALFLALATLLDLIVSWLFMRPALGWLADMPAVRRNPALIGIRVMPSAATPKNRGKSHDDLP